MRRASLGVREQAKTRSGCNGMTACDAGWRDVARSDAQESRKASGKTANGETTYTVDKIVEIRNRARPQAQSDERELRRLTGCLNH